MTLDLTAWLRETCSSYLFRPLGVYQQSSLQARFPLEAQDALELTASLKAGGHLLPLPTEPAALANVLEVSLVNFLEDALAVTNPGLTMRKGSERGYPDIEFTGPALDGRWWAVDVKVAMRRRMVRAAATQTQSRITLYTGNTYFQWPTLHWPGIPRPFADYDGHVDLLAIYSFRSDDYERVTDLEVIVQEPWRIASRQRSSTTREYIGAVLELDRLREGRGDFSDEAEFYKFWRDYAGWKMSPAIKRTLQRMLAES